MRLVPYGRQRRCAEDLGDGFCGDDYSLTDTELDAPAVQVETVDYDVESLNQQRRPGRPVHIDPE